MARASTQPVRLPTDLIDMLQNQGKAAGRSVPAEAEVRLRESFKRGAWADIEPQLTPHSRSLGRLLGFLTNELFEFSPPGKEADYVQQGIARILDRLNGKAVTGPSDDASTMADYWWLRMSNAHEPTADAGKLKPMSDEQKALREIREELLPGGAKKLDAQSLPKGRK